MAGYYLHKEGTNSILWVTLLMFLTGALAFMEGGNHWLLWPLWGLCIVLWGIVVFFFRMPRREHADPGSHLLLSPADGKVVDIARVDEPEYFAGPCTKISVFMSPANVHVNRYPVSGKVVYCRYHAGKYLVAWHEKSSVLNERNTVVIKTPQGAEVLVRQIAGAVARRIVPYAKVGMEVSAAGELGFIKFGSRVDLFFPAKAEIKVKKDQKVKGGLSVLAELTD
ncbi:MAG: phosphatidylserine decarboxylase family protein [Bacteroides sp.]|nr:phosphatidylserine decarboxylase family protein [Ruminococcus flavefaciens]MCM1555380.1 phosphatidylserine decarboxylase family protein [Bacteroides sp.]